MFRSIFTEDFFKNTIGFATILLVALAVSAFSQPPVEHQPGSEMHEATAVR